MDHLLLFHSFCSIHLCHMTPLTTPMNLHCSLCCSSCLAAALSGLSRRCLTKFPSKHLNLMYLFLILFMLDSSNDKYSFHRHPVSQQHQGWSFIHPGPWLIMSHVFDLTALSDATHHIYLGLGQEVRSVVLGSGSNRYKWPQIWFQLSRK